jgi:hypothetical protein
VSNRDNWWLSFQRHIDIMTGCRGCSRYFHRLHRDWTSRWTSLVPAAAGEAPLPLGRSQRISQGLGGIHSSPGCESNTVYEYSLRNSLYKRSLVEEPVRPLLTSIRSWNRLPGVLEVSVNMKVSGTDKTQFCQCRGRLWRRPHSKCYRRHEHYQYPPVRGLWSYIVPPGTGNWLPTRVWVRYVRVQ